MMKKLFLFFSIFFLSLAIFGCNNEIVDKKAVIEEVYANLLKDYDLTNISEDLVLVSKVNDVTIEWVSDDPDIISNDGKIFPKEVDSHIYINAFFTYDGLVIKKFYRVIVKAKVNDIDLEVLNDIKLKLEIEGNLALVTSNLVLLTTLDGATITWSSSDSSIINNSGVVNRQENDTLITLSATIKYKQKTTVKNFEVTVKGTKTVLTDEEIINNVISKVLNNVDLTNVSTNLDFPAMIDNVELVWSSSNQSVISNSGKVVPATTDTTVTVNLTLSYNNTTISKLYVIIVKGINSYMAYYNGVSGLSGNALKDFLHNLIDDHTAHTYDFAKTALQKTDEDPKNSNNVILFYTGRSQAKSTFGSGGDQWNREHVWAKSHGGFGEAKPAGSDLHHLRPTDASVNSTRGNLDFDIGGNKVNDTYGTGSSFCYVDNDSFEPRNEVKGDVARIIFYMAVRYDGSDGVQDLELNDRVNNGTSPNMGRLSVLLKWNIDDPVDEFEKNRNNVIYSYQNNRNPFIDYPQFANLIWGTKISELNNNELFWEMVQIKILNIDVIDYRKNYYLKVATI